jgi:hypothetical protein
MASCATSILEGKGFCGRILSLCAAALLDKGKNVKNHVCPSISP